jgi:hypothetical protein
MQRSPDPNQKQGKTAANARRRKDGKSVPNRFSQGKRQLVEEAAKFAGIG